MREARRMAFGKAVFAEAADLVEAALGEIGVVTALHHSSDHLVLKEVDRPAAAKGRHRLAQLVGLRRGKTRRVECDLHRLLLEHRDPQCSLQDPFEFIGWPVIGGRTGVEHRLLALATLQIGVDHVPLNRPWTDDRDFDHQIVEAARPKPREHVHLRPALDLEYAQRIAFAQHVVDLRHFARNSRQIPALAIMAFDQAEAFADAGQHSQREHVDLEDSQFLDVVLVPFDEGAVGHRAIAHRDRLDQRSLGQDEPADMLRQVAWHSDQLLGKLEHAIEMGVGKVEPCLVDMMLLDVFAPPPDGRGQRCGGVLAQSHHLADFADRRARAVMNHRRRDPRPVAAVFRINVLDHLLAPFMLEIDVDVGRLLALLGDEALEQQFVDRRVDRRNPKAIADRAVGRRSATLAKDWRVEASREIDNRVDRQEIAREIQFRDQLELVPELFDHRLRDSVRAPPSRRPDPGQMIELCLRTAPVGNVLARVLIFQLVEAEIDRVGEFSGRGDRVRPAREQSGHFLGALQMPLGIGMEDIARLLQRYLLANTAHHVLQRPLGRDMIMNVVGGQDGPANIPRDPVEPLDPGQVVAPIEVRRGDVAKFGQRLLHLGKDSLEEVEVLARQGDEGDSCGLPGDLGQAEVAFGLARAHLAQAQQP